MLSYVRLSNHCRNQHLHMSHDSVSALWTEKFCRLWCLCVFARLKPQPTIVKQIAKPTGQAARDMALSSRQGRLFLYTWLHGLPASRQQRGPETMSSAAAGMSDPPLQLENVQAGGGANALPEPSDRLNWQGHVNLLAICHRKQLHALQKSS